MVSRGRLYQVGYYATGKSQKIQFYYSLGLLNVADISRSCALKFQTGVNTSGGVHVMHAYINK